MNGDAEGRPLDLGGGITQIDTMTAGLSGVTAGHLIHAPRPALVECGPALSVEAVIAALRAVGLDADDLAWLVVSHIHLDHAGGAGDVLAAFPSATLVVSERGARHMVDPQRLNASSRRVYGALMDTVYGACAPAEADRVRAVRDGDVVDLGGGRRLHLMDAPGHAKHHIGVVDSDTGALFTGDSVGVQMPGMAQMRPATPPPDFDLDAALRTLARYREQRPARLFLAHYGAVGEPQQVLETATARLREWATVAERAWHEHDDVDHVAQTLGRRFADVVSTADDIAGERVGLLAGVESNAAGLTRYFRTRASASRSDTSR